MSKRLQFSGDNTEQTKFCHVNPYKIETCIRTFPKFKLNNALHLYLTRKIKTGYSLNSFIEAVVGA